MGAGDMLDQALESQRPAGTLAARLAQRGLGPDYRPLDPDVIDLTDRIGVDVDHLLDEYRAACVELHRLRDALTGLARAVMYDPCLDETGDGDPCDCCVLASDLARVWTDGVLEVRP